MLHVHKEKKPYPGGSSSSSGALSGCSKAMDTHCETGTDATGTIVQQVLHAETGSHTISHEQGK